MRYLRAIVNFAIRASAVVLAIVATAFDAPTAAQDRLALKLRIVAPEAGARPGSVMQLTVTGSQPLTLDAGHAFERTLHFWATGDPTDWRALVAVPLSTTPGLHQLTVTANEANGLTATEHLTVTIAKAQFETRRLTVDPRFVNPPPTEAARIAREAQTLADIFAKASAGRLWSEPFLAPVPGPSTSSFGRLTILNGLSRGRHLGADFRAAEGTPVVAPNTGKIMLADDYYFSGKTVVLDHGNGLYSLIGHLSRIYVEVGARVQRGDRIADSGATGRVTGPHLHWAVRMQRDSVDPLSLLEVVAK
jgi:murein DD-endopeptidase MepM/ murein hydrolase activator NlpD